MVLNWKIATGKSSVNDVVKPITDYKDVTAWGKAARASFRAVFRRTKDAWANERAA
jgi:hypothetical protein